MTIPSKTRTISLLLKAAVVLSAAVGVVLSAYAARGTFMSGRRVFMYFTIQSNIAVALISLIGAAFLLRNARVGTAWSVVKFVGTVAITLTGAVFTFILAPTLGERAWNVQNVLTHVVVPAAAILDFLVIGPYGSIRGRDILFVLLPPLAYAVYAGIGYAAGWEFSEGVRYPYFFLNWGSPAGAFGFTDGLPFMGCVWWILVLLALLLGVGYAYLRIAERGRRKMQIELAAVRWSPGYSDMLGGCHSTSLKKNADGEWIFTCRDRAEYGEPTVVTVYEVSPEAAAQFETFLKEKNVFSLENRPAGKDFITDYSPWGYSIEYRRTAFGKTERGRCGLTEYKKYSRRDLALIGELRERFAALRGRKISETASEE